MENLDDSEILKYFELEFARRKSLPNADWLADFKKIFQAIMPWLNVSEPVKKYIKDKIYK